MSLIIREGNRTQQYIPMSNVCQSFTLKVLYTKHITTQNHCTAKSTTSTPHVPSETNEWLQNRFHCH